MPIRELSLELVHEIVESYGQITKLNLSTNGEMYPAARLPLDTAALGDCRVQQAMRRLPGIS